MDNKQKYKRIVRQLSSLEKLRSSLDSFFLAGGYGQDNQTYLDQETYFILREHAITENLKELEASMTSEEWKEVKKC